MSGLVFTAPASDQKCRSDRISVKIKLLKEGADPGEARSSQRINPYFLDIYKHHFLNFSYRYEDLAEYGSMAVICPVTSYDTQVQRFRGLIQPWVDWKNQMGIPSTVYNVTQIGTTYDDIRAFIQDLYDNDPSHLQHWWEIVPRYPAM